ncbi:MAG TPA: recombinase family protein [Candidatus Saccharimonadales bacterium]
MSKKVLAIANCRVSSDEQLLNNSLKRQRDSVIEAADRLNAIIPDDGWWSGSVSSKAGTNITRKDLQEMLDYCKKNKHVKYAIFDEYDRYMRSVNEGPYFEVLFQQLGVKVWYASESDAFNGDDAMAKFMRSMSAFKAEGSNEERQRKSISGQTSALKDGRYPFHPKAGYMRGTNKAVPDVHPVRGPALREALIRIVEHIVTPTDGLIELNKGDYTLERAPLKMDKFRKIATDPFYAGIVEINQQVKVRNEGGVHEPLITLEQHQELIRIFEAKKKTQTGPRKNGNPKFPLNRITMHDTCLELKNKGKFVGFDHGNGKNANLVYEKYRCRSCGFYLTRGELHPKVIQLFNSNPITDAGTKDLIEALDIVWKKKEAQARQDSVRISQKIKLLGNDIDNRAIAAIDLSNIKIKPEILANIEKMKIQVEDLKEELSVLEQKMDSDKDKFLKFAFNFANNMGDNFMTITDENREKCKQIVFPAGFYMDADKNVYTPEISPLITLQTKKKDTEVSDNARMVRVTGL